MPSSASSVGSPSRSRSGSPLVGSPSSSVDELASQGGDGVVGSSSKRREREGSEDDIPLVKCMWDDCGAVFWILEPLIDHIMNVHVQALKTRYSCEWTGCPRKGKVQTSRFALVSHMRSHTGEKPFTCPRPECDKSFTRTDALQKHMKVQHGDRVGPYADGGSASANPKKPPAKRRKGMPAEDDDETGSVKREDEGEDAAEVNGDMQSGPGQKSGGPEEEDEPIFERDKAMEADLIASYPDQPPDYLLYVVQLAKYRHIIKEHGELLQELEYFQRHQERLEQEVKGEDGLLDQVIGKELGPEALNALKESTFADLTDL